MDNKLKILILNSFDSGGGAAIAATRLLHALLKEGHNVKMGVLKKTNNSPEIFQFEKKLNSKIQQILKKITLKIMTMNKFVSSNPILHSQATYSQIDYLNINKSDFDIVNLHWINDDMISIEDISKITKPIIWTIHDSWVFCGAEHHPNIWENDLRYKLGYLNSNKPKTTIGPDICKKVWLRKQKLWADLKINFISPSNFEKRLLGESCLFSNPNCEVIPNIVPSNIFKPQNKEILKGLFNLSNTRKTIGFGAAYDISNKKSIKGGSYLLEALMGIIEPDLYQLVIFGPASDLFIKDLSIPVFFTGYIENPVLLSLIYNACDVFVCPSVIENLPTTCLEALFCGIPVCAFDTGGLSDIVEHKKTGYLAPLFNVEELTNGIDFCLSNYEQLSKNSIAKALKDFNETNIIKKYIYMYENTIKSFPSNKKEL